MATLCDEKGVFPTFTESMWYSPHANERCKLLMFSICEMGLIWPRCVPYHAHQLSVFFDRAGRHVYGLSTRDIVPFSIDNT